MRKRSNLALCGQLIGLVKPLSGFMALAVAMGLAGHLCAAFITVFGGYAILKVLHFDIPVAIRTAFICMAMFAVFRAFLRYGEQSCNHFIAFRLLALLRDRVFSALRALCPAKLEGKDKGNLISVITSDIELLEVFYAHTVSPILIAFGMIMAMCLFIGRYHWLLGLTALAAYMAVGIAVPIIVSKKSGSDGMKFRTKSGDLSSFVLDSLRGLSEILQYQKGGERLFEIGRRTDALAADEERMKRTAGKNMAATNTIILISDLIMLALSAALYQKGALGFDGALISEIAFMSSFGPVIALASLGSALQNTLAAGNRVLDILEEGPVTEEVTGKPAITFSGAACDRVTFSYGNENVLSDVSLDIPESKVTGIIGKSGSGKSTLLKLLMRFWNVQKGKVRISGTDIHQVNTADLRHLESFMTQDTHLFHDSIENNLRIAKQNATREEIAAACKKASIHDFIMKLPKGYDTPVGELGNTLSGGERQRIGLARAFLHDAPLLLLDEPTSNLDSLNEAIILKSLNEERNGRTVVLVSHRESAMKLADTVYSMEAGRTR